MLPVSVPELTQFLNSYGLLFLFVVVLLEYLNMPGFPGGLIFLLAGLWVDAGGQSFPLALLVSVAAGLLGSLGMYFIGRKGGARLLRKIERKHPKWCARLERLGEGMRRHAGKTIFLAKLTPVLRTLVGLLAGTARVEPGRYLLFSTLGITVWNGGLMLAGMFFSDQVLPWFTGK